MDAVLKNAAVLELSLLHWAGLLGLDLEGAVLKSEQACGIYDNKRLLWSRVPLQKGFNLFGFADVAENGSLGGIVFRVGTGFDCSLVSNFVKAAIARLPPQVAAKVTGWRIEAYSFPKLAIQFINSEGEDLEMFEVVTLARVPSTLTASAFERGRSSFLDQIKPEQASFNNRMYSKRLELWTSIVSGFDANTDLNTISSALGQRVADQLGIELGDAASSTLGIKMRPQKHSKWCVPASLEMIGDKFEPDQRQEEWAEAVGFDPGDPESGPVGPGKEEAAIKYAVEQIADQSLVVAATNQNPTWENFKSALDAGSAIISIIPAHARVVMGLKSLELGNGREPMRALEVLDPWPPKDNDKGGSEVGWETIESGIHRMNVNIARKKAAERVPERVPES